MAEALGHCTLIYGENASGKVNLADILRLLTTNNPSILAELKRLTAHAESKLVVPFCTQTRIFKLRTFRQPHVVLGTTAKRRTKTLVRS
jgi:hypothetical protein